MVAYLGINSNLPLDLIYYNKEMHSWKYILKTDESEVKILSIKVCALLDKRKQRMKN